MASNIAVTTYDPTKVSLVVNGRVITGFATDSMITVARSEDMVTTAVGVQGDVTYNENANDSGTMTVNIIRNSLAPSMRAASLRLSGIVYR